MTIIQNNYHIVKVKINKSYSCVIDKIYSSHCILNEKIIISLNKKKKKHNRNKTYYIVIDAFTIRLVKQKNLMLS